MTLNFCCFWFVCSMFLNICSYIQNYWRTHFLLPSPLPNERKGKLALLVTPHASFTVKYLNVVWGCCVVLMVSFLKS